MRCFSYTASSFVFAALMLLTSGGGRLFKIPQSAVHIFSQKLQNDLPPTSASCRLWEWETAQGRLSYIPTVAEAPDRLSWQQVSPSPSHGAVCQGHGARPLGDTYESRSAFADCRPSTHRVCTISILTLSDSWWAVADSQDPRLFSFGMPSVQKIASFSCQSKEPRRFASAKLANNLLKIKYRIIFLYINKFSVLDFESLPL